MSIGQQLGQERRDREAGRGAAASAAAALRRPGRVVLPGMLVVALQVVAFPVPLGVALQGVIVGLLGALVAVGMGLVYRANRILNFAQFQLGLAPTVLAVSLIVYSGLNYILAVTVGLVGSVLVGSTVELVVIRRFFRSSRLILTVATIGLSQLLVAGTLFIPTIWGQIPTPTVVHVPLSFTYSVFPMVFTADHLVALVVAPLALLGVALMLRFTDLGIAVRASAERADRAAMLGVPVKRLGTVVWGLAGLLSFIGVFLQAGILGLPEGVALNYTVLLAALTALVLGNLVELPSIAVSAVALGLLQQGVLWNNVANPDLVDPVLAGVVVVALLVKRVGSSRAEAGTVTSWSAAEEARRVPAVLARLPEVRAGRWGLGAVVAGLVLALPWMLSGNAGDQLKATAVVVFVMITLSVLVLTGWAGQVTLGQMSFVGFGGAAGTYATQTWHLDLSLALLVAGVTGAVVAVIVSLPTLRLRGFFPAVTTLAFAMASSAYLLNNQFFSWIPVNRVPRPRLFGRISLASQPADYYFCLACLALVVLGLRGIRRSRTGRVLLALRENDRAVQSFGVNLVRAKLTAFAVSGFVAGVAGCLLVQLLQAFSPDVFGTDQSILVFTTAVVGGLGSLLGAALGAVWLQGGQWFLPGAEWQVLVSAVGVLVVLMVFPGGLSELAFRLRDHALRRVARRRGIRVPGLLGQPDPPHPTTPPAGALVADHAHTGTPAAAAGPEVLHDLVAEETGL